jgi:membrane protease YdiL (CAAX protease family)
MSTSLPKPPSRDLAAVVFALFLPSIITWIYFFQAESAAASTQLAIFNVVKVIQFAFPLVWVVAVQKERINLRPQHAKGVAYGLAFGLIVAAAIYALYFGFLRGTELFVAASDEMIAKLQGWRIDRLWKYIALGVGYSLIHSMLEEYYWRWFVYGQLRRWLPIGPAVLISSLGFMAHHVLVLGKFFGFDHPATWLFSISVAVGGAVWAWLYERTGSLIGPWASHLLVDAALHSVGYDIVRRLFSE